MNHSLACVVDASVGIKKFVPDSLTPKADKLFAHLTDPNAKLHIPDLFYIECTSIIWKYVRFQQYDLDNAKRNLVRLKGLRFVPTSTAELMTDALDLGSIYGISAYDACYASLAKRENVAILTQDKKLIRALKDSDIDVQLFSEFSIPPLPSDFLED
ncbi:MAG: type II toxin-antitoxin system VapC family toxin [Cyanobacteria bacterium J06555_13]